MLLAGDAPAGEPAALGVFGMPGLAVEPAGAANGGCPAQYP